MVGYSLYVTCVTDRNANIDYSKIVQTVNKAITDLRDKLVKQANLVRLP